MFRRLFASFLFLLGVAGAVLVGIWLCFVDGIIDIVHAAQASPLNGGELAWGIVKVFILGGIACYASVAIGWICAYVAWTGKPQRPRRRR